MIGFYLLVTIFSQLSPQGFWAQQADLSHVKINVDKLNGLRVGNPVIADGIEIGNVEKISDLTAAKRPGSESRYEVDVTLDSRTIQAGTIALLSSSLSRLKPQRVTVVELLSPPASSELTIEDGQKIIGYSSFEAFWSADDGKHSHRPDSFHLG